MFTPRTATGLTIALLALPATATAYAPDSSGGGAGGPATSNPLPYGAAGIPGKAHFVPRPYDRCYGVNCPTSPQDLQSPDAADAARAGEIAKAMEHYQRSQPLPAAARPASPPEGGYHYSPAASHDDTPAWPEFAFAGVVLLATAGGVVTVRMRRRRSAQVAA
jgi:hypothetical protein